MGKLLKDDVQNFISEFAGRYELIDFGFSGDDYLKNGFWIKLRANFDPKTESFSMGRINFIINEDEIYVDRGFLDDIGKGLAMIK